MNLKDSLVAAVVAANVVFAACALSAADWYVAPNGTGGGTSPSDRGDLMDVLYNGHVASGDTIHLAVGTYNLDASKSPERIYPGYGGA